MGINCELPSLLALRATCKALCADVTALLAADRTALAKFYVDNPDALWLHLEAAGAVIGGLAALVFVLRSCALTPPPFLDIYVASHNADILATLLQQDHTLGLHSEPFEEAEPQLVDETCQKVARKTTYVCSNGRTLIVHCSASRSCLEPVAACMTTALCNWVSAHAFASGYPALTLNRRAFSRPICRSDTTVATLYIRLHNYGFLIEPDPWPSTQSSGPVPITRGKLPCMRAAFLCPRQARFFGDGGSLLNVFDPLKAKITHLRESHQPPFGITTLWRRRSDPRRLCDGRCTDNDPLLPKNVFTMATILLPTPIVFRCSYLRN